MGQAMKANQRYTDPETITRNFEGIPLVWGNGKKIIALGQAAVGGYYESIESDSMTSGSSNCPALEVMIEREKDLICEGAYIFDKRSLPIEVQWKCVSGPMPGKQLEPLTLDYWGTIKRHTTVKDLTEKEATATTYLSYDLYAEYWRRLGAKIGRFINGQVVWE